MSSAKENNLIIFKVHLHIFVVFLSSQLHEL
jgi:hypothetical protein